MGKLTLRVALLTLAAVAAAFGTSTPIPTSLAIGTSATNYSAVDYIDSFSFPSSNEICPANAGGCGGEFQASINAGPTLATPATATSVWCVDYQLDVTSSAAYTTDITMLSKISTPDAYVRYGNLPTGTQTWVNTVTDPTGIDANNTTSAAYRYTLAAALVSQYQDTTGAADPTNVNGSSAVNTAIQEAIWYITYNTDYQTGATWPPFAGVAAAAPCTTYSATNYNCWVQYAENNANKVNLNAWAVVSGPANSTGQLLTPQNNSFQTFLVQVATPEPTYRTLNLLGASLLGFFLLLRHRRAKV